MGAREEWASLCSFMFSLCKSPLKLKERAIDAFVLQEKINTRFTSVNSEEITSPKVTTEH